MPNLAVRSSREQDGGADAMGFLQAALDVSLCRAITVAPAGISHAPLPIRAARIGASLAARAWRIDLRDHLIFPGLINAHEHLHVNAVPPLPADAPFANSYAWIAAQKTSG